MRNFRKDALLPLNTRKCPKSTCSHRIPIGGETLAAWVEIGFTGRGEGGELEQATSLATAFIQVDQPTP